MALIRKAVVDEETIVQAMKLINDYDEIFSASQDTEQHYAYVVRQLTAEKGKRETLYEYVTRKTEYKNSWFLYRSAIRHEQINNIKKLLDLHAKCVKRRDQKKIIDYEQHLKNLIQRTEEISNFTFVASKRTTSKKNYMKTLPDNWVELVCQIIGGRYKLACIIMGITGCRPQELAEGIRVEKNGSELTFSIKGAKVKRNGRIKKDGKVIHYNAGQKVRHLTFSFGESDPLINLLLKCLPKLRDKNYSFEVKFENKKSFASSVREAGKKLWPRRKKNITPIMFRHQVSSNNKASGLLSDEEQSCAIGHIVTVTKKKYGHPNQKRGGLIPVKVLGSDPVKISRPSATNFLSKLHESKKNKKRLH